MRILLILGPFLAAIVGLIFLQTGMFAPIDPTSPVPTAAYTPPPAPTQSDPSIRLTQVVDVIARIPSQTAPQTAPIVAAIAAPVAAPVENPEMRALTGDILAGLGFEASWTQPETQAAAPAAPGDELRVLTSAILAGLPNAAPVTGAQQGPSAVDTINQAINTAIREGRPEAEIDALIAALVDARINQAASAGQITVPEAFFTPTGRVDAATLLTSINARASAAPHAVSTTLTQIAYAETTTHSDGKRYYVVETGDSLASIAHRFYGDAMAFQLLFEANSQKLSSPNMIKVGQKLHIPG